MTSDTQSSPDIRRYLLIIAGIALVIAVILLERVINGGDEGGKDAEEPVTPTVTESSQSTDGPSLTPVDEEDARAAARAGVEAYTQYSWKDPASNTWIARLEKVSTKNFIKSVRLQFPSGDDAESDWKFEVVDSKRETRTTVDEVAFLYGGDGDYAEDDQNDHFDDTTTAATFNVGYMTALRTVDTNGWTTPTEPLYKEVTVVKITKKGKPCAADTTTGCVWRVNGIRDAEGDEGGGL